MFKKSKKMLVALSVLALSTSATAGGLMIGVSADDVEIDPIAKYTFADETNLGKDSMGNWDLTTEGTVTKSTNGALFEGAGVLHSPSEDKDISETLTSFTLNFTMTPDTNTTRAQIVGFGWNDWVASKYSWFTINEGGANDVRYSMHGGGDATTGRDWGKDIITAVADTTYEVTLTVQLGGKAVVYIDGVEKYNYAVPDDWNMQHGNTQFCIGGDWVWYNENRSPYKGEVGAVTIYDFAMTSTEVSAYWTDGKLTTNEKAKVASATVDYSETIKVEEGGLENEILAMAPVAPIEVTLSDDSKVKAPVAWTDVVVEEGVTYIVGTLKGVYNPDNVQAKLKVGYDATIQEVLPVAKYEFKEATNPGKDSMGNWDLSVVQDVEKSDQTALLTVADGVLTSNGVAALLPATNAADIGDKLTDFTLSFEMKMDSTRDAWQLPIGFGANDWTATQWMFFTLEANTTKLRLTTGSNGTGIDGTDGGYYGKEIGSLTLGQYHKFTISLDIGGKMNVYMDGVNKYSYDVPAEFSLVNTSGMRFCVGGLGRFGNVYSAFMGNFKNVTIYDFAMNAEQVATYESLGALKTNRLASGQTYVKSVGTELTFVEDKVVVSELFDNMEVSEMLSKMGSATAVVTLSDDTTKTQPVVWTNVVNNEGTWTAYGYVENTGLGLPTTVGRTSVEQVVPVTSSKQVSVGEVTNGSVEISQTYGLPGDVIEITATANAHYELDKVYVDGNEVVANGEGKYLYTMGDADIVVTATFKAIVYTITADSSITNGSLSFSPAEGAYGTEVTVTATPAQYYVLSKVYVNGTELTKLGANYTFEITGDMTVNATFVEASYSVDAFVYGGNGSVSTDKTAAKGGETVVITVTPNEGYEVDYVKANDVNVTAVDGVYSIVVEGDVEIEVKYKAIQTSDNTSGTGSGGDDSSSGGCFSTTGLTAGIALLGAAACVVLKKKKND